MMTSMFTLHQQFSLSESYNSKVKFCFILLTYIFLNCRQTSVSPQMPPMIPQVTPPIPNFPFDPLVLRAAFNSYFPFQLPTQPHPMASLFPPIEALTSSQALSALATKKRSAYDHSVDSNMSDAKRQRYEDPLDLSSAHLGRVVDAQDDVDVDVLSVDPPTMTSRNDPERWSVDQVALFVANIESCQEYAEVRFLIHFASDVSKSLSHSIKCNTETCKCQMKK